MKTFVCFTELTPIHTKHHRFYTRVRFIYELFVDVEKEFVEVDNPQVQYLLVMRTRRYCTFGLSTSTHAFIYVKLQLVDKLIRCRTVRFIIVHRHEY